MEVLPKRINYLIDREIDWDITDAFHLITVSDVKRGDTLLSLKQIDAVYGLCEVSQRVLSDTIIHNTITCYNKEWDEGFELIMKRAGKIIQLLNTADDLSSDDVGLMKLFSIVQSTLEKKSLGRIQGNFANIRLVRRNIERKWCISFMNIDSLKIRVNLYNSYYNHPESLGYALENYHLVSSYHFSNDEVTETQRSIELAENERYKKQTKKDRLALLDEIRELHNSGKLDKSFLQKRSKLAVSSEKKIFKEVNELYDYLGTEELIQKLKKLNCGNSIGFKNLKKSVIFWALEADHPLKLAVYEAFRVGRKYTNHEIEEKMNSIVAYHFHKDWTANKRKSVSLFKCFFKTIRPRNEYIIQSSEIFSTYKNRIKKDENNMFKYFML